MFGVEGVHFSFDSDTPGCKSSGDKAEMINRSGFYFISIMHSSGFTLKMTAVLKGHCSTERI